MILCYSATVSSWEVTWEYISFEAHRHGSASCGYSCFAVLKAALTEPLRFHGIDSNQGTLLLYVLRIATIQVLILIEILFPS